MIHKRSAFAAFFLFCIFIMRISASALTYTDNMETTNSTNNIQYLNFVPSPLSNGSANILPDIPALTISDVSHPIAYAQYRVQGATSVSASIYSPAGTFVAQDDNGAYVLGVFRESMGNIPLLAPQALFCPSAYAVYSDESASMQLHLNHMYTHVFDEVKDAPKKDLIGYGVNFYYSADGISFTRANAVRTDFQANFKEIICYETYSASVPSSAKYLRVELNDAISLPLLSGGYFRKEQKQYTALASVIISGEFLVFGAPEKAIDIPVSVASEDDDDESYDDERTEESILPTDDDDDFQVPSNPSKSSSSKFEGTITSSPKSSKEPAPVTDEPKEEKKPSSTPEVSDVLPLRDDIVIYEIPGGKNKNKSADSFLTGAIILVSGGGVVYLIIGIKK